MTANEFFDKYNGKPLNPDQAYGNQCVDVADQYAVEVVGSPLPPVNGAKDFWNKNLIGYTKIPNTPDAVPHLGDIIIFDGLYGHVSIFKEGDQNSFTSFDQNFPSQGYIDSQGNYIGTGVCHYQTHDYDNPKLLGWFRPLAASEPMGTITQKELDQIRHDRDQHYNDLQTALAQVTQLTVKLTNLQHEYDDYQKDHPTIATSTSTSSVPVTMTPPVPPAASNQANSISSSVDVPTIPTSVNRASTSFWARLFHSIFG